MYRRRKVREVMQTYRKFRWKNEDSIYVEKIWTTNLKAAFRDTLIFFLIIQHI